MLYKKYVIEVVYETQVMENFTVAPNASYENQISMNFTPIIKDINSIMFMRKDGFVQKYAYVYNTYGEAFEILSTHYYTVKAELNVESLRISPHYDDISPPVEVLRAMKIKNILD
jgi:hypothetical protein